MAGALTDPAVQQIFDDIIAFMGSEYSSVTTTTNITGTGTNQTMNCVAMDGGSWNYSQFSPGAKVSVTPVNVSLGPSETQQYAATATNPDGSAIAAPVLIWSVTTTGLGSIDAAGLYTAPAAVTTPIADQVKCALGSSMSYSMVTVSLHV